MVKRIILIIVLSLELRIVKSPYAIKTSHKPAAWRSSIEGFVDFFCKNIWVHDGSIYT